jgi:hypothetical protein
MEKKESLLCLKYSRCLSITRSRLLEQKERGLPTLELDHKIGVYSPVAKKIQEFDWDSLWVDEDWISLIGEVQNLECSFIRRLEFLEDLKVLSGLFPEAEKFIDKKEIEKKIQKVLQGK